MCLIYSNLPSDGNFFTFTRHEPVGVCGQIIPVSWSHLKKTTDVPVANEHVFKLL